MNSPRGPPQHQCLGHAHRCLGFIRGRIRGALVLATAFMLERYTRLLQCGQYTARRWTWYHGALQSCGMSGTEASVETISQRQLRNDSGEILRRAAAGESFRIRAGDTTVDLQRSFPSMIEQLTSAGRLSTASDDDFADSPEPGDGLEALADTLNALRRDR